MSLRKLFRNIKLLSHIDLRSHTHEPIDLAQVYDNLFYEISDAVKNGDSHTVCGIMESLDFLIKSKASMVRFGDGEISLMCGDSIPFQSASPLIATRLKQVLSACDKNLMVGIPSVLYKDKSCLQPYARDFWRNNGNKYRNILEQYINFDKNTYYAAEMTLGFANRGIDKKAYFSGFRKIWNKKDIVIVCGKTVFDKITHNIFDNANSVEYVYAPSSDAFAKYDEIFNDCMKCDKNKIFVVICGPTAKILCYDLFLNCRRALDVGHIAKSYDWYMNHREIDTLDSGIAFFAPD